MYEANINNFLALNPGIRKETHMESAVSIYPWFKDLWELVDINNKIIIFKHSDHKILKYILN